MEENLLPSAKSDDDDSDDVRVAMHTRANIKTPPQYSFLEKNRAVREKIENWQTRVRRYGSVDVEQALFDFYASRISQVSSLHELNRLIRDSGGNRFLEITEAELTRGQDIQYDAGAFPDTIAVGGQPVPISYAYAPGEEHDGITIRLPFTIAQTASSGLLEWAVPGLREEKIAELLRALPKAIRRELMPFPPKVAEIVRDFQPTSSSLLHDLGRFIHQRYGVDVPASSWPADALPAHLRTRVEVIGENAKTVAVTRDLQSIRPQLEKLKVEPAQQPVDWQRIASKWERFAVTTWNFGDLPERVTVLEDPKLPVYGWLGLELEDHSVNVRLFRSADAARNATIAGVQRLVELEIQKDLGWIEKDLRALTRLSALYAPIGSYEELFETALKNLKAYILPSDGLPALKECEFRSAVEASKQRIPGTAQKLMDLVGTLLQLRQQIQQRVGSAVAAPAPKTKTLSDFSQLGAVVAPAKVNPLALELAALLPSRFLEKIPFTRLPNMPRYLKALLTRCERASMNPAKDQERAQLVEPYRNTLKSFESEKSSSVERRKLIDEFRWMIEEYKVSVFAQELGTAFPISTKRLDEHALRIRQTT